MTIAASPPRRWLFKSEPDVFSFQDLMARQAQTERWDGVRNYQARNLLRDQVKLHDTVLFYHSNAKPPHAAGLARVVREAYPDPLAQDPSSPYFDARCAKRPNPWVAVDVQGLVALPEPVSLATMRACPALVAMKLLHRGQRLSIQPLTEQEFWQVLALGGLAPQALAQALAQASADEPDEGSS